MPKKNNERTSDASNSTDRIPRDIHCRTMSIRAAGNPATIDEDTRSVDAVFTTENPVMTWDMARWELTEEVLLMSGVEMPDTGQIPLLDSHDRYSTETLIGSGRNMRVEGDKLMGRIFFSNAPEATGPYTKIREGHLTDVSIGYRVNEMIFVPEGKKSIIEGREFEGPLNVVTRWQPREISVCAIGADEAAKIRSASAAPGKKPIHKEEHRMDEKLRALLVQRGLPETATDEEAWAFAGTLEVRSAPPPAPPSPPKQSDEDTIREAVKAERVRVEEIYAMCRRFEMQDMAAKMVSDGVTLDHARAIILEKIAEKSAAQAAPAYRPPITVVKEERDKFRSAAEDSIILRSGMNMKIETPAPGAEELRGFTLRELAREALRIGGHRIHGNSMELVGRALTTSDFPYILANVANKSLFAGWEGANETWSVWCATGSVSDFKTHYSVRAGEYSDLEEIPEETEYKYGTRAETRESYAIATYGKMFALSRQAIINDDLGALTNVPAGHGEAAARKIGDLPYAVLTGNAAMGDGVALFDAATHKNLVAHGSGAAPGVNTIAAAFLAMGTQKDLSGLRRLNIVPVFFIGPRNLQATAEIFFNTMQYSDSNTIATDSSLASTRNNIYAGNVLTRVYDARLDDATDSVAWYLAAAKGKTITVFFLDGVQTPYMETKQGWSVDGVEWKVRIDAGAKALDYRGLYQNHGH